MVMWFVVKSIKRGVAEAAAAGGRRRKPRVSPKNREQVQRRVEVCRLSKISRHLLFLQCESKGTADCVTS